MVCSKFSKFLVLIWQCSLACLPLSSFSWAHLLCVPLPPKTWQSGQGLAVSFLGSLTGFWFLGLLISTKMRAWSDGSHVRWQGEKKQVWWSHALWGSYVLMFLMRWTRAVNCQCQSEGGKCVGSTSACEGCEGLVGVSRCYCESLERFPFFLCWHSLEHSVQNWEFW